QYHSASWSADGKRIYCSSTAEGRDIAGLAEIEVASGNLTYLEKPEHEVEGVVASPKGQWLAYRLNVGGKSELKLRDLKPGTTISPKRLPLGVLARVEVPEADSKVAFVFDGPRHNLDVWI